MKAIVFTSTAGTTKKYADMLSEKLGIPAYSSDSIPASVSSNDEIIYMGWLFAGGIKGYKKTCKSYNVKAVCAVGMSNPSDKLFNELKEKNKITDNLFYLQGGFDINKLSGSNKLIMKALVKAELPKLESKQNKTAEDERMINMMTQGANFVCEENLIPVVNALK